MIDPLSFRCDCSLHGEEDSGEVCLDDVLEGRECRPTHRRVACNARIGKHDVELSEFLHRLRDCAFELRNIGCIGVDAKTVRSEFGDCRVELG
jgi:hypothetical protein